MGNVSEWEVYKIWFTIFTAIKKPANFFAGFLILYILRRRRRDSNSRNSYPFTHFPGVLLQPLGHVSFFLRTTKVRLYSLDTEYFFGICRCCGCNFFYRNIFCGRNGLRYVYQVATFISFSSKRHRCQVWSISF